MSIGDKIKARRTELKLTLEDIAKYIGISKQTVQRYETGIVKNIPSNKIEKLSEILKVTPVQLMGWDDITEKETTTENDVTFDDFTYAFLDETKELTDEDRELLLDMARTLKARGKKKDEKNSGE